MADEREQDKDQQKNQENSQQGEEREDASKRDENGKDEKGGDEGKKKGMDPRRKRTIRFIALAVVVVAIIVAIPIYFYYSVRESTDDAQIDGHVIPISPRISGYVQEVFINDNEQVKAGESLVKLDPADYQVALQQAQAQLAGSLASASESKVNVPLTNINTRSSVNVSTSQERQAQAAVKVSAQGVNAARASLSSSKAALTQAQANFIKSQKDLDRLRSLVEKDEISKQEYDGAVAAADANAAQVESAKAGVLQAQHMLDQSIAQVEQSKASLATAVVQRRQNEEVKPRQIELIESRYKQAQSAADQQKAAVDQAKLNLAYTLIKAPISGTVSRKSAEPGMQVAAGQQLMALIPLENIWVTANFKETQLKNMHPRQEVEIEVDTYGGSRNYKGHIDSIAAASGAVFSLLPPQNATGNYVKVVQRVPVKIVFEPGQNRDHRLVPGMSVVPTVLLNSYVDYNKK